MALGMHKMPKRGLFGARPTYGTPGIGDGMRPPIPAMADPAPGLGMRSTQPMDQAKPGFGTRVFGEGWEDKAFALGGLLAGDGGRAAYGLRQQEAAQQEAAMNAAAEQRKRAEALADYGARKEIDQRYDTPDRTSMQQNYDWLKQTNPQAADAYLERMTNNYEYRQGADGQFYRVDIGGAQGEPQVIGKELPDGWSIEGDGASNGTGNFPR